MATPNEILKNAYKKIREIYGEDFKAEVGDSFVFAFKNGTLILTREKDKLKVEFSGDEVIPLDMSCDVYEQ